MRVWKVLPDRVTILAQLAERADEIDAARAEAARRRAGTLAKPLPEMDLSGPRCAAEVAHPAAGGHEPARGSDKLSASAFSYQDVLS